MSSKVICPLGLINNCQSEYPNGKGCRNYDYCHEHASTTVSLPYYYDMKRKCLTVNSTYPQSFIHRKFNPVIERINPHYHQLTQDSHDELVKLGFGIASSLDSRPERYSMNIYYKGLLIHIFSSYSDGEFIGEIKYYNHPECYIDGHSKGATLAECISDSFAICDDWLREYPIESYLLPVDIFQPVKVESCCDDIPF